MSDTRTITREQLAAALMAGKPLNVGTPWWARQEADRIFAALPAAAPAEGLREAVLSRHAEKMVCTAHLRIEGDRERPVYDGKCGYGPRDALHDLYPDHSKRDRLYPPLKESQRHAFEPEGYGTCLADGDEWPCAAVQLARAALARHESGSEK